MDYLKYMQEEFIRFRNERDWDKFHNSKDLALSLVLEASELMEHFQWKTVEEYENFDEKKKGEIAEEIIDVIGYSLLLSDKLKINIADAFEKKMQQNREKYPVEKAKGRKEKYNQL